MENLSIVLLSIVLLSIILIVVYIYNTFSKNVKTPSNSVPTTSSNKPIIINVDIDITPAPNNNGTMGYLFNGSKNDNDAPPLKNGNTYNFILSNNVVNYHPFGIWDITSSTAGTLIVTSDTASPSNSLLFTPLKDHKYRFRCKYHGNDTNTTDKMKGDFIIN